MRINKKIIFIVLIIVSFLIILFFFFSRKGIKKTPSSVFPTPKLTSNYKGKFPVNLLLKKEDLNLPQKLNLLEVSSTPLTEDYAKNVAQKLGFQGEPLSINDVFDGKTFFWKNNNFSFFVFPQKGKVRYSQNASSPTINKQLSDQAIETLATTFLNDGGVVDTNNLSLAKIRYLEEDKNGGIFKEAERSKATVFEVSFNYKVAGYEILTPQYIEPIIYAILGQDGVVQSFQFINIDNFKTDPKEYTLKSYQEIVDNLQTAILISLFGSQFALSDLAQTAIQKVDVNKIEIGYLYDPGKSTLLQPVYKLTGTAKVEGYEEEMSATLYLPALSSNQP